MSSRGDEIIQELRQEIQRNIAEGHDYISPVPFLKDYFSQLTGVPQIQIDVMIEVHDGIVEYTIIINPVIPGGATTFMTVATEGFGG